MLATIILDSFTKFEASEIADALEVICSPEDNYGFASACIYAFWSVPERDILYLGLARDIATRFRQHTGLVTCDPACCKRQQIDAYFQAHPRLGYSIMVQSTLDQPVTPADRTEIAELYDEAFADNISDYFSGEDNIVVAEGFLLELHDQLGDRLPLWNKIRGSNRGRQRCSLSPQGTRLKVISEMLRTGTCPHDIVQKMRSNDLPYHLLLNLTGHELSDLNARAALREIAADATVEGHEEFLHGIRMRMVVLQSDFDNAMQFQLKYNEYTQVRIEAMKADGYLQRKLSVPGT